MAVKIVFYPKVTPTNSGARVCFSLKNVIWMEEGFVKWEENMQKPREDCVFVYCQGGVEYVLEDPFRVVMKEIADLIEELINEY